MVQTGGQRQCDEAILLEFGLDPARFCLGIVCPQSHEFQNTGKGLRYRKEHTRSHVCVQCARARARAQQQANPDRNAERSAAWRKKNAARSNNEILQLEQKRCSCCKKRKPASEFKRDRGNKDGLDQECRDCASEMNKNWRKSEAGRMWVKIYRARPEVKIKVQARQKRYHSTPKAIEDRKKRYKSPEYKARRKAYYQSERGKLVNRKGSARRRARIARAGFGEYTPEDVRQRFERFNTSCAYCGAKGRMTIDHFTPIVNGGSDCLNNLVPACFSCNRNKSSKDPHDWYKHQPFYSEERWQRILEVIINSVAHIMK